MRHFALGVSALAAALVFSGCVIKDSGDPGGTPCSSSGQCSSGACLEVSCQNGNAPRVCGGLSCVTRGCIGDQTCVDVAGTNESYCVPNSVCGGGGCNTDCDNACAYIYGTCALQLPSTAGGDLTESECIQACTDLNRVNMEQCAQAAQCDMTATVSCFQ